MKLTPQSPDQGFQFPGEFELTAMGPAAAELAALVPGLLREAGVAGVSEVLRTRPSSNGNYLSVTVAVFAETREHYEAAHEVLRKHPDIKWTL
ncbi:DUF493 family protein [Pseudomarimonas salicorniae]|uniref:DUF493 family protein n=1 Tax=Pseudomarimonas salicorniae TaxID=2933270 RepID=A0ABT0GHB1_9GAMM|nr:DUF493 family protein [Lysobacter sp. CAU 1642]MCK7593934.1 DUF493 family protein [Lysobacter sp. CAU 1642]